MRSGRLRSGFYLSPANPNALQWFESRKIPDHSQREVAAKRAQKAAM
jgi:hypothetical protein